MFGKIFIQKTKENYSEREEEETLLKRKETNHQAFGGKDALGSSIAPVPSG